MNGKKIAFIVVALATVGGIGYFLYKRNKNVVSPVIEDKPIDKQKTLQELKQKAFQNALIEGKNTREQYSANPTYKESLYE
jgi:Flp pilus assembly protein CpaB